MGLIIPKCNADPRTLDLTLKIYYDANDWVENSILIDRLSAYLISEGIEDVKKEPQSYTKKTQVLSYYGLIEWEDESNNQSRRRITENGKKLYQYREKKDLMSVLSLLIDILTNKTFGRNVLGCDSDSDLEAPNIFLKSCLMIKDLTNKEFGFILGKMEFEKMELADALFQVVLLRSKGLVVQPDLAAAKWSDPKPILALADWGLFTVTKQGMSKIYNVNKIVIDSFGDRLNALRTKNTDVQHIPIRNKLWEEEAFSYLQSPFRPYITAIKSKPFLLLAGISGTGKSRIVRELARACWDEDSIEYKAQKPKNFEMIQVKPNWHDSTELMGYISRVSGKPIFVAGDFLKFIVKAWENIDVPYFLCLDEMNLAPVEQYFAEFLSVIESRKRNDDGNVITDPIIKPEFEINKDSETKQIKTWYSKLIKELLAECPLEKVFALTKEFEEYGISIPQNLIVIGTVNMDETTFSFSRKVLDRAMTIEMNEVDLYAGLDRNYECIGKLKSDMLIGTAVEGVDVYADNEEVCNKVLSYLQAVNDVLNGTPFKIAYRTRNEFLLYVVNNLPYNVNDKGNELSEDEVIAIALDEITSMKILSRIEGDDTKIKHSLLEGLITTIEAQLLILTGEEKKIESISVAKLKEMKERLTLSGYTSFWS